MAPQPAITPKKFSNQRKPPADERTRKWRDVAEGDELLVTLRDVVRGCRVTSVTAQEEDWAIYVTWHKRARGGLDPDHVTMLDTWHVVIKANATGTNPLYSVGFRPSLLVTHSAFFSGKKPLLGHIFEGLHTANALGASTVTM